MITTSYIKSLCNDAAASIKNNPSQFNREIVRDVITNRLNEERTEEEQRILLHVLFLTNCEL